MIFKDRLSVWFALLIWAVVLFWYVGSVWFFVLPVLGIGLLPWGGKRRD